MFKLPSPFRLPKPFSAMVSSGGGAVTVPDPDAFYPLKTSLVATTGAQALSFSRATIDNVTDFEGLLRPCLAGEIPFTNARRARNVVATTSEDFSNAAWTKTSCSITGSISDPLGGTSAYTMTATGANGIISQSISAITVSGDACISSIWIRRRTGTGAIAMRAGTTTFNTLDSGAVTSSWRRVAVVATASGTAFAIAVRLATSGDEVDIWHAQGESSPGAAIQAPSEYISVGVLSSPYHGANVDGVKYFSTANGNTLTLNVVTEATGAALTDTASTPIGYHCEPAATNICKRSAQADNATWVKTNITVAADSTASPSGSLDADTLTASAGNGTFIQDLGTLSSVPYTFSVYIKRLTGTGNIQLTLDGGSTWTTRAITAGWARYEITQTVANPDCGIRIVTNGDAVYVWGMQVEASAFATRYIATVSVNVSRNADALTVSDAVFSNAAGTVALDVSCESQVNATGQQLFGQMLLLNSTSVSANDDSDSTSCTVDLSDRKTISTSWQTNMRTTATGATADTITYDGSWPAGTTAIGGSASDGARTSVVVSNLKIWNSALSEAQQDLLVG